MPRSSRVERLVKFSKCIGLPHMRVHEKRRTQVRCSGGGSLVFGITVVVPSYNCADYLAAALESVVNQTIFDWQLIVIDDGSTDNTRAVVSPFLDDARIQYLYQENRGLPAARNAGIRETNSEFVAFLDADDALREDALQVMSLRMRQSSASWCLTDILKRRPERDSVERSQIPRSDFMMAILRDDFIRRGMFFRRSSLVAVGMYDETMRYREDWDLNIRMFLHGEPFVYVPKPLYLYSWREGSITTGSRGRMLNYTEKLLRKHHKRLADADQPGMRALYSSLMWGLSRNYWYEAKDHAHAVRCALESLRYDLRPARILHPLQHRWRGWCAERA